MPEQFHLQERHRPKNLGHKVATGIEWTIMISTLLVNALVLSFILPIFTAKFLQPDPLQVAVQTLEEFTSNQTNILKQHTDAILSLVQNFNSTLSVLSEFLESEKNRGARLRKCLEDPSSCQ